MSDALANLSELLNPFLSHLRKMELELKCSICFNLLSHPKLLPCNHLLCSQCTASSSNYGSCCLTCKSPFLAGDLKPAILIESMLSIFKGMDAAIGSIFLLKGSQADVPDSGRKGIKDTSEKKLGNCTDGGDEKCVNNKGGELSVNHRELCSSRPIHACTKHSDDQGNEPRENKYPPNYSCKMDLNVESVTNVETEVASPRPANPLADEAQESGRSSDTINSKSTSRRKEESGRKSKRRKLKRVDDTNTPIECVFCHSFRTTEGSGQMEHYLKGKLITVEEANQTDVIHVHKKCLEWAPLVYFDGETAKDLKKELSRASKLKCAKCGLNGAALGCYSKHCQKSFHVPCAYETPNCQWDCVHFAMLCPLHASEELPCDKSEDGVKIENKDFFPDQLNCSDTLPTRLHYDRLWTSAPHEASRWTLCGSDLSTSENEIMGKFADLTGATVTKQWDQNVTHVIASTDEHGACTRTFKVLMAILSGRWVLTIAWLKACMESRHPVPEESYEIGLDNHGCVDGPKNGRFRAMKKAQKIFSGFNFYFISNSTFLLEDCIEQLVLAAGGTILNRDDFMNSMDYKAGGFSPIFYIVYIAESHQECTSIDIAEALKKRREEAEDFAAKTQARVIGHTWLVDAIAASSLEIT